MEDIFKPSSLTIKQLFGNTDSLYQIPRYQRPYSWNDEQLEKLWDDLKESHENNPNYFLGSVITAKPEESSTYLDVVDGQQRLTTLTILMCVYRDLYPKINHNLLDTDPFAVDNKILETSIRFNDRFERLRLKTHSNHQSDFDELILVGNTTEYEKPFKKDIKREEDPSFKFKNTAWFFTQKLTELGEDEAGRLLNYIFNSVKIIRIDCQTVSFAIKLFQVLNDRGLELSNSDLIKSYLIGRIQSRYDKDQELKRQKEDQFIDDWKSCETIAIDTYYAINDLFVMYEYYLLAANPKRGLYDELVSEFQNKEPNKIISDFKNFCTSYKEHIFDAEDKTVYGLYYLRWAVYWRTIITTSLHSKYPQHQELSKALLRYYYLNWIAGYTLTKIKQISFNIIKWIKEGKPISFIKKELEINLKENSTISKAVDNLNNDIYNEPWCKPLLAMIEYQQLDDSNLSMINIWEKTLHVEHILPRGYKSNKAWENFHDDEDVEDWINSGGNLTLLSGAKNIAASNDSFAKKIKAYSGKGFYKEGNEGVTAFRITQQIVDDYNAASFDEEWNWDAMFSRWNWFCSEVSDFLDIDLDEVKHR
ncbi:MAG: DUF262 domain-containing protein [Chitinophagaceae bacterium]|nr:DUF262 domain-containing protein [Chitinophagaceae bacterium]